MAGEHDTAGTSVGAEPAQDLEEVLQELRVVQTGVQILSAFLLTLPFTARFSSVTDWETGVYVLTLVAAAATTALVIAPVSYHRRHVMRGESDLRDVVRVASTMAHWGMATLLVSAVTSVLLAIEVAAGLFWALLLGSLLAVFYIGLWYVLPAMAKKVPASRAQGADRGGGRR